jgi:uncharacterized lipoprotein YmbA
LDEVTVEMLSDGYDVEVLIDGSWCIDADASEDFRRELAALIEKYRV